MCIFMTVTIEKMKKIINNPKLSDKEIEVIRDELQAVVKIIFQKWNKDGNQNKSLIIKK